MSEGRPQFVVVWRDVQNEDGSMPDGTGISYRCFAIQGTGEDPRVFEDEFESGDASRWSDTRP